MIFNKKSKELPQSVSAGFFGILLVVSLLFNVALFLRIQNIPDGISELIFPPNRDVVSIAGRATDDRIEVNNDVWVRLSDPKFDIIYLQDEGCTQCADLTPVQIQLANNFLSANVKTVSTKSDEGQKILEEGGVSVVPAIIFSQKFAETGGAPALAQNGLVTPLENGQFEFRTAGNKRILNAEQLPAMGETPEGTITIIGFIDYLAQDIGTYLNQMIAVISNQYPDKINVALLPFVDNVASLAAAEAFLCGVDVQRLDAVKPTYLSVVQGILNNNQQITEDVVAQIRQALSDLLQLEGDTLTCYTDRLPDEQITQATIEAQRLGVTGAPAFFVGDRFLAGPQPFEVYVQTIAELLDEPVDMTGGESMEDGGSDDIDETPAEETEDAGESILEPTSTPEASVTDTEEGATQ